jgi:hypothetical protein
MKFIKTYEGYGYKWKNIVEKNDKLYINLYQLAREMEYSANNEREFKKLRRGHYSTPSDIEIISNQECEYRNLIFKLLIDKVISFEDENSNSHFGICDRISFESGPSGFVKEIQYTFQFEYISIRIYEEDEWYNVGAGNKDVIVHLNIDPEIYKNNIKFNI